MSREAVIAAFLERNGASAADAEPPAADAEAPAPETQPEGEPE